MREWSPPVIEAMRRTGPYDAACCANCENLEPDGHCFALKEKPPIEFIEVKDNGCPHHQNTVPF